MKTLEFFEMIYQDTDQGILNIWTKSNHSTESFDIKDINDVLKYENRSDIYFGVCLQRTKPENGERGKAKDAYVMPGLWFDLDIAGDNHKQTDLPADADTAMVFIDRLPFKPTIIVSTGGGYHLYYLFNKPWILETEEERQKAEQLSRSFQGYIQAEGRKKGWKLDNTSDLARILRLPNTNNIKNNKSKDVEVTHVDNTARYDISYFDFVKTEEVKLANMKRKYKFDKPVEGDYPLANIEMIVQGCPWMNHCYEDAYNLPEPEWFAMLSILGRCENANQLAHDWSNTYPGYTYEETDRKLKHSMNAGPRTCYNIQNELNGNEYCRYCRHLNLLNSPITLGIIQNNNIKQPEFERTDLGNAKRLVYYHGSDIHYHPKLKSWIIWNGKVWKEDEGGIRIQKKATDAIERMKTDDNGKDRDYAKKCESLNKVKNMITLAKSQDNVPIFEDIFDPDPMLLNCQNGTIDLKTGELKPHRREDMITRIIPVEYDPDAKCPRFLEFMDQIMDGNKTMIEYLKRIFGYSLSGDISEQAVFFAYGNGGNGKSKLLGTIQALLGDYAVKTNFFTFIAKKNSNNSNDIARLRGSRFLITSEADGNQRLSESIIKEVSGDDTLAARFLFKEFFEFKPSFKLFLATNQKPLITGVDNGIWRRIKLIPFKVKFEGEMKDKKIEEKLYAELKGILNWCLEGCTEWQRDGLKTPDEVKDEIKEYREDQDFLESFFNDRCILSPVESITKKELYQEYQDWAINNKKDLLSMRELTPKLREKGLREKKVREKGLREKKVREKGLREKKVSNDRGWSGITINKDVSNKSCAI